MNEVSFKNAENGGLTIFSLFIFILILIIAGTAVDVMRSETQRVAQQNTADAAVLAATSVDMELNSSEREAIVRSYFNVAGLEDTISDIQVSDDPNNSFVIVQARSLVPTFFMKMMGIDTLPSNAASRAEQVAQDIEISLVLDISSSMNGSNRINNLVAAVNEFIDRIVPEDGSGPSTISVSIVPYSMTTNPGAMLAPYYNIVGKHSYSSCVFFENADYQTLAIDPAGPLERYSHYADNSSGYKSDGTISLPYCPENEILAHSTDRQELRQAVAALRPWDATGIDIGVKWGLHLLDPSFQPILSDLANNGLRDAQLVNSPGRYGDATVRKILILMSDGENDGQRDLVRNEFREGFSLIWFNPDNGTYSVLVEDAREANVVNTADVLSRWYHEDSDTIEAYPDMDGAVLTNWEDVNSQLVQMPWPDVFNIARSGHLAPRFFQTPYEQGYIDQQLYNDYRNPYSNRIPDDGPNGTIQRTSDICSLAKERDIEVFGISFDPPNEAAKEVISDCASSAGHFFPVQGLEISTAFEAISQSISLLRLTD